jgi:hypothetical protein
MLRRGLFSACFSLYLLLELMYVVFYVVDSSTAEWNLRILIVEGIGGSDENGEEGSRTAALSCRNSSCDSVRWKKGRIRAARELNS